MEKIKAYAIDFGTSNSLLSAVKSSGDIQSVEMDASSADKSILRSVMYFSPEGVTTFGREATHTYADRQGEGRLIRSIKKYLPAESFLGTRIGQKNYRLEELIGRFLREMKQRADRHFAQDVRSVVMGRPARFSMSDEEDQLAESRLAAAAEQAGFEKVEFFAEPLAAAYDFRRTLQQSKCVLIVDLGGGTSDFTVIRLSADRPVEVLSLGGVSVAGDALDGAIMSERIAPFFGSRVHYQLPMTSNVLQMPKDLKYRLQSPADITLLSQSDVLEFFRQIQRCPLSSEDEVSMERLFTLIEDNLGFAIFEAIESCKRKTCEEQEAEFVFDQLREELATKYSYQEFLQDSHERVQSIFSTLDQVVSDSGLKFEDIDLICCTGGTSKVPVVQERLQERFGASKVQSFRNFHSVIQGLAERAREVFL